MLKRIIIDVASQDLIEDIKPVHTLKPGSVVAPMQEESPVSTKNITPFKNTTVGKTVRTLFQSIAGILLVFAVSDDFREYITNTYPQLAVYIPLAVALFTALQNGIDPSVKNI